MKVLLINGSPHKEGCTYTALTEVANELNRLSIETELFHIGTKPISGCTACGYCRKTQSLRCVYQDTVNEAIVKMEQCDAMVVGSPVHYASASGSVVSFLDRMFYASGGFALKPGAAIVTCRRGGATAAFDQLNKYFLISGMPLAASQYWNMVHGNTPDEIRQDLEGLQTMRTLARNLAWLLACIEAGKRAGVPLPEIEIRQRTNFIR